jgi:fatty-acyl-CoA synthase
VTVEHWGLRYGELIERRADRQPDRPAVIFEGRTLAYRDVAEGIRNVTRLLRGVGVAHGDRVVCVSGNRPEVLLTAYACSRIGAAFVPLNPGSTQREIEYVLDDVRPSAMCIEDRTRHLSGPASSAGIAVIDFDGGTSGPMSEWDFAAPVRADDPAVICYTSGTTGQPKGVVLTHSSLHWNSLNTLLGLDIASDDVALINTPLFHVAALNVLTVNTLYKGGTVLLQRGFDAESCLDAIQAHRVTTMFAVPTMLTMLEQTSNFAEADLSNLRWVLGGGAPFAPATVETWLRRGIPVIASFGLSEAGPSVSFRRPDDVTGKFSSSGPPGLLTDLDVVNRERGIGELVVRGPHVAAGYWNKPEATAAVFRADGLHTGDRGYLDQDGDLMIVGRSKEVIITGGENVDPVEVEQAVCAHPAVAEAVVVGVPDPLWGERVAAVVVLVPGAHLDLDDLRSFTASSLAKYKLPRQVELWEAIPKTSVGKIRRGDIQARVSTLSHEVSQGS